MIPPARKSSMFPDATKEEGGDSWIRMGYTTAMLRNLPNKQLGRKRAAVYWVKLGKHSGCVCLSGGLSSGVHCLPCFALLSMVDASLTTSLGGGRAFEISNERVDAIAYFALGHASLASRQ